MKYQVNVNEIKAIKARLQEINGHDIDEVEFVENGESVSIPQQWKDDWRGWGDIVGFVDSDAYKEGVYPANYGKN
jgi:hypothetical protein